LRFGQVIQTIFVFVYIRSHFQILNTGYTTTLTMNLPYAGMWFASYESLCKLIYSRQGQPPLNEAGGATEIFCFVFARISTSKHGV